MQAHHRLPVKFKQQFNKFSIKNIHDPEFGAWAPKTEHLRTAYAYNQEWKDFFARNPNPTVPQILSEMEEIWRLFGLGMI